MGFIVYYEKALFYKGRAYAGERVEVQRFDTEKEAEEFANGKYNLQYLDGEEFRNYYEYEEEQAEVCQDRQYYNYETNDKDEKELMTAYLKKAGIYYEVSGAGRGYHFEILATAEEADDVNGYIEIYNGGATY